jgi:hypothetical protein
MPTASSTKIKQENIQDTPPTYFLELTEYTSLTKHPHGESTNSPHHTPYLAKAHPLITSASSCKLKPPSIEAPQNTPHVLTANYYASPAFLIKLNLYGSKHMKNILPNHMEH